MKSVRLALLILLVAIAPRWALGTSASDLDPSFGNGGIVTTSIDTYHARVTAGALQSDGKLVVVGWLSQPQTQNLEILAVTRYDVNGHLDATFGSNGVVTTGLDGFDLTAAAVIVQPDGKILVGGIAADLHSYFLLVRYSGVDGSLDQDFGEGGIVRTRVEDSTWASLTALAILPDGSIMAGGAADLLGGVVARYEGTSGMLDITYGTDGFVTLLPMLATGLLVQNDGNLVVLGTYQYAMWRSDGMIGRLDASGRLDTTFGTDGFTEFDLGSEYVVTANIVQQPDGKLVAGASPQIPYAFAMARFDADGHVDPTFGDAGFVMSPFNSAPELSSIAVEPNGKLLAIGYDGGAALARYLPDGRLDESFGAGGIVITGSYSDSGATICVAPNGRFIVSGTFWNDDVSEFAAIRYLGDSDRMFMDGFDRGF